MSERPNREWQLAPEPKDRPVCKRGMSIRPTKVTCERGMAIPTNGIGDRLKHTRLNKLQLATVPCRTILSENKEDEEEYFCLGVNGIG